MQYFKCRCGNAERWCSGYPVHPCEGCEECGTTLASGPNGHEQLQPYKWQLVEDVTRVDGVEIRRNAYYRCMVCEHRGRPCSKCGQPTERALEVKSPSGAHEKWVPLCTACRSKDSAPS